MFTYTEMLDALYRLQTQDQLPPLVVAIVDEDDIYANKPVTNIGEHSEAELPRACYDFRDYQLIDVDKLEKKSDRKDAKKKNEKRVAKFKRYLNKEFTKDFFKRTDIGKKHRDAFLRCFYVKDFRVVQADRLIDTNDKNNLSADFKGKTGLLITFAAGPKQPKNKDKD